MRKYAKADDSSSVSKKYLLKCMASSIPKKGKNDGFSDSYDVKLTAAKDNPSREPTQGLGFYAYVSKRCNEYGFDFEGKYIMVVVPVPESSELRLYFVKKANGRIKFREEKGRSYLTGHFTVDREKGDLLDKVIRELNRNEGEVVRNLEFDPINSVFYITVKE